MASNADRQMAEHNARQRRYYDGAPKSRMLPADTPYIRRHVDELLRCGRIGAGDRVLEVGCGMGRYTLRLAQLGLRLEALDLSPILLERLTALNRERFDIPLHCTDIVQAPRELAGRFDAVIGFFALHHLHDVARCIGAMVRLLKPGGRLVFLEPNPYNVLYYVQITFAPGMSWAGDRGVLDMRPRRVRRWMRAAGLRDVATTRFGFFPPFMANHRWGARVERQLERIRAFEPVLPFQLFRGTRPAR